MKPTARLRFIIRWEGEREIRILQQWWVHVPGCEVGEWRDVPMEVA